MPETDRLNATFAALADPTRRAILARLALGETSVQKLAEPFDISLPAISRHLKVLEHAGLISRGRDAQMRPCKIDTAGFIGVDHWLEEYRKLWSQSMDKLESYLEVMKAQQATSPAPTRKSRSVKRQGEGHGRKD
ncbi:ArsR/SmtB family transcription factor [Undibacter mobilis]|uniref:ArsR family transcriptional regulator n=1 Tax=Undibacter mobilis TaxID=2292256 RepID=A0A371B9D1_9BRAD|nr:metalloregulator ArsR/SmtB family transcription factor [Undibacter mobilis]RDV04154.1 ArsR family transcriptional regulator [Undibacter mobilis]